MRFNDEWSFVQTNYPPDTNEIFIYVEDDFAQELTDCSPSTQDDGNVQEHNIHAAIEAAIERWNQQSQTLTLHFEGTVPTGSHGTACTYYMDKHPAVLVNFHKGCQVSGGSCLQSRRLATAGDYTDACGWIRFWGDPWRIDYCEDTTARDWAIATDDPGSSFQATLLHEIGHILGLGHPPTDANGGPGSVMSKVRRRRHHLYPWDKDCARYAHNYRDLDIYYMWQFVDLTGLPNGYFAPDQHFYGTRKHFTSAGSLGGSGPYYGLYSTTSVGFIDYTAAPSYSSTTSFSSYNGLPGELDSLDVSPLYYSNYGWKPNRVLYHRPGNSTSTFWDPPYARFIISDDLFVTENHGYLYVSGAGAPAQTHLPFSAAYDPSSGSIVVVRINTNYTGNDQRGRVIVHPGFTGYKLEPGSQLTATNSPFVWADGANPNHAYWNFTRETEGPVGVACTNDYADFPYNCLLAWQDRGIPEGHIAYTYFRIGSGPSVDWLGSAYIRDGARSIAGVQAAYSHGAFRMAWKEWAGKEKVSWTRTGTGYTDWIVPQEVSAPGIVSPPTFLYHHHDGIDYNNAIVWTASDTTDN